MVAGVSVETIVGRWNAAGLRTVASAKPAANCPAAVLVYDTETRHSSPQQAVAHQCQHQNERHVQRVYDRKPEQIPEGTGHHIL